MSGELKDKKQTGGVVNTLQEVDYEELEKALVAFHNETRKYFVRVPPHYPYDIPEAKVGKSRKKQDDSLTFFSFGKACEIYPDSGTYKINKGLLMSVKTEQVIVSPAKYVSKISINTGSFYFGKYLKSKAGFELTLLHEMLHIKDAVIEHFDFEYNYTSDFDYTAACYLIGKAHPLTTEGNTWFWSRGGVSRGIKGHGTRFMTLCYYLARELLKHKKILKRLFNGNDVEGSTTWKKREWLAVQIYRHF